MFEFEPKTLNELNSDIKSEFLLPEDYAFKDASLALDILEKMRAQNQSFETISVTDINMIFHMSKFCTQEEFEHLYNMFKKRITSSLFYIGWAYCQINPNEERAVALFSLTCQWMDIARPDEFAQTLIGRVGLPWSSIYKRFIDIAKAEKLSIDEFCIKYKLFPNTLFCQQLHITYYSRCEKEELLENEIKLSQMITTVKVQLLKPVLQNLTAKIVFEEIPSSIFDAINSRLAKETSSNDIGLSPTFLQRLRHSKYSNVFEEYIPNNKVKQTVYSGLVQHTKSINLLNNGFFSIDFENYIVLDCIDWPDTAYAFSPNMYKTLLDIWVSKGYPADYWPGIEKSEVCTAHDIILNVKKGAVIKIGFSQFELLYTKELLSSNRY